jgi:hypothetical protein
MEACGGFAASTGAALRDRSTAGVAVKSSPNPYTQTEAIRAPTDVADPPTTVLVLPGRWSW